MEIAGLPLHFLVVHATVVFTPLAAAAAVVFALVPRWRWLLRWPTVVTVLIAFVTIWVARLSGNAYLEAHPQLAQLVATHQDRGELLSLVAIGYLVVVLFCAWALGGPTGLASGRGARDSAFPGADTILAGLLVLASLAVLVLAILTGDAGARAVWGA